MRISSSLYLLFVLAVLDGVVGVSLDEFFPFGQSNGDELLPPMTDGSSGLIPLRVPFPFFDRLETTISVDVHGTLMFEQNQAHHTPDCSPVESLSRMIAVFWADIVTHEGAGGSVLFRQDSSPNLLRKASRQIVEKFPKMSGLRLKWLFIATWLNVTFYGAEGCQANSHFYPRNTFQTVLATDGTVSFAIFNYNSIVWTTSRFRTSAGNCSGLGGFPARVGFDPGDLKNFYSLNESCTHEVVDVDVRTNSGQPGRWLFRIDNSHSIQMAPPQSECSNNDSKSLKFHGKLRVMPSFVDVFGGPVTLHGPPCLDPKHHRAVCTFHDPKKGKLVKTGKISGKLVKCIAPFFHDTGRLRVDLEIIDRASNSTHEHYHGFLAVIKKLPEVSVTLLRNSDGIEIEWDPESPSLINATAVDVGILEFNGGSDTTWHNGGLLAKNIPNTGRYEQHSLQGQDDFYSDDGLAILTVFKSQQNAAVRKRRETLPGTADIVLTPDYIDDYENSSSEFQDTDREDTIFNELYRESQISDYILKVGTKTRQEKREACLRWYEQDEGVPRNSLIPCPPTLQRAKIDEAFEQDPCAHFENKDTCLAKYHPRAIDSYLSSNPNSDGHGQQCTYDQYGNLLVGPPNGGTADIASPWSFFGETEHMERDIVPWIACCSDGDFNLCLYYYEKRPSDDGTRYQDPALSSAVGDPHITTFDGLGYTFNGVGEFWMVKPANKTDSTFRMQARMERFNPPIILNSTLSQSIFGVNGSIFSAFVMRDGDLMAPTVQVQLAQSDENRIVDVLVDGDRLSFDDPLLWSQQFDGFSIRARKPDLSDVTVSFASGVSFRFLSNEDAMSVISAAHLRNRNAFFGLLGNFDGDAKNDLTPPNGEKLDPEFSTLSQIHYDFGLKWMVRENESMFTYIDGENFTTFTEPDFIPMFELPKKLVEEIPSEVLQICGLSEHCVFDYLATGGNLAVASYTAVVETIESEVKSIVEKPPPVMCPSILNPRNGYMMSNGSSFFHGVTVRFMCDTDSGYRVIGPELVTCQNGTWSEKPPQCLSEEQIEQLCQPPSLLRNGTVTILSSSSVKFSCNTGFILVGLDSILCKDGVWNAGPPICQPNLSNSDQTIFLSVVISASVACTVFLVVGAVLYLKKRHILSSSPASSSLPKDYHDRILVPPADDLTKTTTSESPNSDQKLRQPLL